MKDRLVQNSLIRLGERGNCRLDLVGEVYILRVIQQNNFSGF